MYSRSALSAYDLPEPLKRILDLYDKPCKGAWRAVWICLGLMLTFTIISIVLLRSNSTKEDDSAIDTNDTNDENSTSGSVVYFAYITLIIAFGFMIALIVYSVRGNPCKERRELVNAIMTDELTNQGYLANPELMKTTDKRQWRVMAKQIQQKIDKQMRDHRMRRVAVAAVVSTALSR